MFRTFFTIALTLPLACADEVESHLKSLVEMLSVVKSEAAEPVDEKKAFYEGAIPGMLRKLDPHSIFFDPDQFEQLKEMEKSTRKGFGTIVSLLPGRVIVLQTMPGSPSAKAGISAGDEILAINNYPIARLEVEQLVELLSQARQNRVEMFVRRQGSAGLLQFTLAPEDVDSPSVDRAYLLAPGIGYLRVTSFDVPTGKLVRESIEKLGGADLKGLVIDLRNNPGGVLGSALETASMFLEPGQRIITAKGRRIEKSEEIDVPKDAMPYKFPVAIIMNAKSASGSEVVAGALQDHGRAKIIGLPSFGKGLVQNVFPLSNETGLALTIAHYYTPKGRNIQKPLQGQLEASTRAGEGGIHPDQIVYPAAPTRLRAFLDSSGALASFATQYLQKNRNIDEKFEVTNQVLDEFQLLLSQNNIRPGISEWSADREWIRTRLRQELFNQALGVAKGDEVEASIDDQIQAALDAINSRQ